MPAYTIGEVRAKLRAFIDERHDARFIPGYLYRPDGSSTYTIAVPGGEGKIYVRMGQDTGGTLSGAYNRSILTMDATNDNLPVWLTKDPDDFLIIVMERRIT